MLARENSFKDREEPSMHYGMVIDLKLCIGCNTCAVACKARNGTPPGIFWRKVLEQEVGTFPLARRIFWSISCMHCEEPACVEVCPTGASYQREDGVVLIDANKCTGCGACVELCPKKILFLDETDNVCRVTDETRCDKRRGCERVCPSKAIKIH